MGRERTRLSIHAAIAQDISDPLYALMNNGHMTESLAGFATLDDVEEGTFIGFSEYAYTGQYVTPELSMSQPIDSDNSTDRLNGLSMENGEDSALNDAEPDPAPDLDTWAAFTKSKKSKKAKKNPTHYHYEFQGKAPDEFPEQITVVYPYEQLWERFRSLVFDSKPASFSSNPDILFHAKLYVFATKYLIEPLRQQCLRSLHRDLSVFSLNPENRTLIFDLLGFTYANTGRLEAGGRSALRDLVIHYIACEIRTLADDKKLYEVLDSDAEIGSDLVMKLVA